LFAHDHVDLFPVIPRWPRPNHVDEHARKRDNSTNDFSRNNLFGRYPLGQPEPDMSCDTRDKILQPPLLVNFLNTPVCTLVSMLEWKILVVLEPEKKKKEYGIRKKEDPWLVMAFNPAPVIR
jgi:hypothetical protein